MSEPVTGLQNITWSDIGYSLQPCIFLVCGTYILLLALTGRIPRPGSPPAKKILIVPFGLFLMLTPLRSLFTDGLFVNGKIRLTIISRFHGTVHPEVNIWGFGVSLLFIGSLVSILAYADESRREAKKQQQHHDEPSEKR